MIQKVREQLIELADEKYKEFNQSLVPGDTYVRRSTPETS